MVLENAAHPPQVSEPYSNSVTRALARPRAQLGTLTGAIGAAAGIAAFFGLAWAKALAPIIATQAKARPVMGLTILCFMGRGAFKRCPLACFGDGGIQRFCDGLKFRIGIQPFTIDKECRCAGNTRSRSAFLNVDQCFQESLIFKAGFKLCL